ncbi:hypothetical protein SAMN05444412_1324 [Rhodonellum ikkaensis]|uniref:Uncharacterized protein n=1 Tax=Rhodonellum ikkaensis TaxID=336829 RepID=A0A1H3U6G5_9BACT|nr:hypothetical protein SAMN05444412_1324 [Rhodonellum ikkaensis]
MLSLLNFLDLVNIPIVQVYFRLYENYFQYKQQYQSSQIFAPLKLPSFGHFRVVSLAEPKVGPTSSH